MSSLVDRLNETWAQGSPPPQIAELLGGFLKQQHGLDLVQIAFVRKGSNLTFKDQHPYFVKCFPPGNDYRFIRETYGLSHLRSVLPVHMPKVIAQGSIEHWQYLVLTGLPGHYLRDMWPYLSLAERCALARHLGEMMACLHQTPFEPLASFQIQPKEMRARETSFQHQMLTGFPHQLRQAGLHAHWLEICLTGIQTEFETLQTASVLLHRHMAPQHLLIQKSENHWHITGLVDFDGLMGGPPAAEFVGPIIGLYHDPAVLQAMFAGYGFILPAQQTAFAQQLLALMLVDTRFESQWLIPIIQQRQPRSWAELSQAVCYFLWEARSC